jgi:tryprostatin B 6-hydroxylase
MELRTVTAILVLKYDILFAEGEDGSKLLNNTLDAFVLFIQDLNLVFKERSRP